MTPAPPPPPAEPGILTIAYPGGAQRFALANGGYVLEHGRLLVSIDTENLAGWGNAAPNAACLCLENQRVDGPLAAGMVFTCTGGLYRNEPDPATAKAHGWFDTPAEEVHLRLTVLALLPDHVVRFRVEAAHDGTLYDDPAAPTLPTTGTFDLPPSERAALWFPL